MSVIEWAGGTAGTYSLGLGANWVGGHAPGTGDTALFAATATGPYTLSGTGIYQSTTIGGDTILLDGSIATSGTLGLLIDAGGYLTIASGAVFSNTGSLDIGGTSLGELVLIGSLSAAGATLLSQGTLGVDGGTLTGTLALSGGELLGQTDTTIGDNIYIGSAGGTIAAATGTTLTVSPSTFSAQGIGVMGPALTIGADGAAGVVALDPGSLVFPSGSVTIFDIAGGTLREAGGTLLRSRPVTIQAGATLDVNGNDDTTDGLYGAGIVANSAGTDAQLEVAGGLFTGTIAPQVSLDILNAFTFAGTDLSTDNWSLDGLLQLGTGGSAGSIAAGSIQAEAGGTLTFDQGQSFTLASDLSGPLNLIDGGAGAVVLTGTDTGTGTTSIAAGATLIAGSTLALGTGAVTIAGSLETEQTSSLAGGLSMESGAVLAAAAGTTLTVQGSAGSTITLAGTVTFGAAGETGLVALGVYDDQSIVIADGTLRELAAEASADTGETIGVAAGATLDLNGYDRLESYASLAGDIVSTGGDATLTVLNATIAGTIGKGVALSVNHPSATITLTGSDLSDAVVNIGYTNDVLQLGTGGAGGLFAASSIDDTGTVAIDRSDSFTLNSVIALTGSVVDEGAGPLILGGANDYSGGTSLAGGAQVQAANATAFGTGGITLGGDNRLSFGAGDVGTNTIANFGTTDVIVLDGVTASSLSFVSGTGLVVNETNNTSETLNIAGHFNASGFSFTNTAAGTQLDYMPCFAEGTRILTLRGVVSVDEVRVGDEVVTVRPGGPLARRVIWTGRRRIDLARHPKPAMVRPIRIVAGAIAAGVPERDLRLSPEHAVYLDGHCFTAASLVNGRTIYQERHTGGVTYHHIELTSHDILMAEGLPCESYLDTGSKAMFDDAGGVTALHPDFRPAHGGNFCVPLIRAGAPLAAIRARLRRRASSARPCERYQAGA